MATNNFLNTVAILGASAVAVDLDATSPGSAPIASSWSSACSRSPPASTCCSWCPSSSCASRFWLLTHTLYRIRIVGSEHVPSRGPALLVCNHLSHVDGALVGACVQRFVRFLVYKPYYEHWAVAIRCCAMMQAIPVARRHARRCAAIDAARARTRARPRRLHLRRGRDQPHRQPAAVQARLRADRRGPRRADRSGLPRSRLGQRLQLQAGTLFLEVAEQIPYPVTVAFGAPMPATTPAAECASR